MDLFLFPPLVAQNKEVEQREVRCGCAELSVSTEEWEISPLWEQRAG